MMLNLEKTSGTLCKVLRFVIAEQQYVANIDRLREIVLYRPSIPVPHSPPFLKGVIDLRGLVIPLIDMRERLGIPPSARSAPTHILVVGLGETVAGLVVDHVRDVLQVDTDQFQIPDASEGCSSLCRGVCRIKEDLLLLIDLDAVLSAEERAALAGVI